MSTTLITGASGFVGTALGKTLERSGERVISLTRDRTRIPPGQAVAYGDVRDADLCRRLITDYEVDTIYHLAAQAIVSSCAEDPVNALDVAAMGTARLCQAAKDAGRPIKVIVSTSDKVYGAAPTPYTEETPLDARHPYEVSKACQDLVARMYAQRGLDVRVVRAVNIYGPGDPNESRLIPKTAVRLLRGEAPLLNAGAADMRRQYVYISDLISALLVVARQGAAGQVYCVGSPDPPMSVLDVMRTMAAEAGVEFVEPVVKARDERFCEIFSQEVRDDKLRALGWSPLVGFQMGVELTLASYRKEQRL